MMKELAEGGKGRKIVKRILRHGSLSSVLVAKETGIEKRSTKACTTLS